MHRIWWVLMVMASVLALTPACGGGGGGGGDSAIPTLAGSPIPTVPPPSPTPLVCTPPRQLDVPANFPQDVPLPPDFVTWSVSTAPHLRVVGRVTPPVPDAATHVSVETEAARAIVDRLNDQGWKRSLNNNVDGTDYDLFAPDGRRGHLNVNQMECPGQVQIVYEFQWITP